MFLFKLTITSVFLIFISFLVNSVKKRQAFTIVYAAYKGGGMEIIMKKKIAKRSGLILTICLLAGLMQSPVFADEGGFNDVNPGAYYAEAVNWAVENGITGGTGNGMFSPNATCSRAQAVTFLWRVAGSPKIAGETGFSDVSENAYYADAVKWAVNYDVTGGVGAGKFAPDKACSRAEIVTFMFRAAGSPPASRVVSFNDVVDTDYYSEPVNWAFRSDITSGTGANIFSPHKPCTRGQIVTFLYRWHIEKNTNYIDDDAYSDQKLCEMAISYYKAMHGEEAFNVTVESSFRNFAIVHIYIETEDGYASTLTMYEIDRNNGTGEDLINGGEVDLLNYSQPEVKQPYSDDDLLNMAAAYYRATNKEEPPVTEIDSKKGNMVTVHLYDDAGDLINTWAWYEIDRTTGKGVDMVFGTEIDFSPYYK